MKKYSLLIKGKNLKVNIGGKTCRHGFFTTRYIEADNGSEAKRIAINLIEQELGPSLLNDSADSPRFLFEEVLEVEKFDGREVPGAGFTWFEEN